MGETGGNPENGLREARRNVKVGGGGAKGGREGEVPGRAAACDPGGVEPPFLTRHGSGPLRGDRAPRNRDRALPPPPGGRGAGRGLSRDGDGESGGEDPRAECPGFPASVGVPDLGPVTGSGRVDDDLDVEGGILLGGDEELDAVVFKDVPPLGSGECEGGSASTSKRAWSASGVAAKATAAVGPSFGPPPTSRIPWRGAAASASSSRSDGTRAISRVRTGEEVISIES